MTEFAEDESISSWINRQAVYARQTTATTDWSLLLGFLREKELMGDIDFHYSKQDAEIVSRLVDVLPSNFLDQGMSAPLWLLSDHRSRVSFCSLCVERDLLVFRVPVWRRSWSAGWCVVCPEHKIPMTTLQGLYGVLRTEDRHKSVSRYFLESRDRRARSAENREILVKDLSCHSRQVQALVGMAWSLQRLFFSTTEVGDHNQQFFEIVLDMCSAMLRFYTPGTEGEPYVQWICRQVFGREPLAAFDIPAKIAHVDYEQFRMYLEQSAQTPSAHKRMIALALTACILEIDTAYQYWDDFVVASRQCGMLVADSPDWLYCAALGPVGSHARQWHLNRIREYPPLFRDHFLQLINSSMPSIKLKAASRDAVYYPSGE